jgi:hypothetical protein
MDSMFITGCQARLNMRPPSLLKFWLFSLMPMASHKMIHVAQRSVQNNGVAEVDAMPCVDTVLHHRRIVRLIETDVFFASRLNGSPFGPRLPCHIHMEFGKQQGHTNLGHPSQTSAFLCLSLSVCACE